MFENSHESADANCPIFQILLQYSKRQTRAQEIEKCLDEGLEPTYYFSIFSANAVVKTTFTKIFGADIVVPCAGDEILWMLFSWQKLF